MAESNQEKGKRTPAQSTPRDEDDAAANRPIRPAPIKVPEGGDENLRRRAEWLRQRQGQS